MSSRLNLVAGRLLLGCSLLALLTIVIGVLTHAPPPPGTRPDEGALAHIFQLSVFAAFITGVVFLATADWSRPARSARPLILPAIALAIAFGALYYLEHHLGRG